nr:unnamed protein product [Callosobruchus chinensis]
MDWLKFIGIILFYGTLLIHNLNWWKKIDIWQRIASAFNCEILEVKKKIESLLTSYRRELRRENTTFSGMGTEDVYHSKWFAFRAMQFLNSKFLYGVVIHQRLHLRFSFLLLSKLYKTRNPALTHTKSSSLSLEDIPNMLKRHRTATNGLQCNTKNSVWTMYSNPSQCFPIPTPTTAHVPLALVCVGNSVCTHLNTWASVCPQTESRLVGEGHLMSFSMLFLVFLAPIEPLVTMTCSEWKH